MKTTAEYKRRIKMLESLSRQHVLMFGHRVHMIDFPKSGKVILQCFDCDQPLAVAVKLTPLSDEAKAARRPSPPESLVGARHDKIHLDIGKAKPARTARVRGKGK